LDSSSQWLDPVGSVDSGVGDEAFDTVRKLPAVNIEAPRHDQMNPTGRVGVSILHNADAQAFVLCMPCGQLCDLCTALEGN